MLKRRVLFAVAILLLLLPLLLPAPIAALSGESIFESSSYDGHQWLSGDYQSTQAAAWNQAHDTSSASSQDYSLTTAQVYVHARENAGTYRASAERAYLYFDTSSLPDNAVITSATIQLYVYDKEIELSSSTDFILQTGGSTYPHVPMVLSDFAYGHWSGDCGQLSSSSISTNQYNTWTLTSAGRSSISTTSYTKFILREEYHDENNVDPVFEPIPGLSNYIRFYTYEQGAGYRPKLTVTYTYTAAPSVTTGSASSVLNTTATLAATITSTGDSAVTRRGVQYGLSQTPTWDSHEDGSFETGDYSRDVTGLSVATTYWFRGYAVNAIGTGYGSWVSFTTKDYPTIATVDASNVAGSSARLNSALESDGGDDCTINFGWGLTSESVIEDYDSSETLSGTYNTGAYPYLDVSGLLSGYTYYFRVSATNLIGTDLGDELTFETPIVLEAPTNFVGYPEATSISLSWSKGSGSTNTLIRYGSTTYPTTITSGTYAYSGPSTTYTLEGLSSGKTYYISAWGESGGNYSATYATLLMTTSASAGTDTSDIDVPAQPSRWFSVPDYTGMAGLGILYDAYNNALDTGHVPRETGWFLGALGLAFLAGLIAYLKLGKKLMIGMIAMTVVLAMGYFMKLVPFWVPLMMLILVIVFSQSHKQADQG